MGIQNPHNRKGIRIDKDAYETPEWVTKGLMEYLALPKNIEILEPACASGLMVKAMRDLGYRSVTGQDLSKGQDFLRRTKKARNIITNPPYKDDLPERFARHALDNLVPKGGYVALLLTLHFLGSNGRFIFFSETHKPFHIIYMSDRIRFLVKGKPISGQAYDHCWVIWKKGFTGETTSSWYCRDVAKARRKSERLSKTKEKRGRTIK
jgi:hypothetical protein